MLKKRISVVLAVLIVTVSLFVGEKIGIGYSEVGTDYTPRRTIIIDAGHGGFYYYYNH